MAELVYPAVITFARGVFAMQGLRFDLRGTENVPRTGGAVMVINHIGYMDFTYAGLAARPAGWSGSWPSRRSSTTGSAAP
jgi:1-acyl-sn-glycerol-3-phosphate acyltransferase